MTPVDRDSDLNDPEAGALTNAHNLEADTLLSSEGVNDGWFTSEV